MNKKILLVDVDSKIPNIALGKLSTYHKQKGDKVDYLKLGLKGFSKNGRVRIIDGSKFDRIYSSNIFTSNQKKYRVINCSDHIIGGVGSINSDNRLQDYIDVLDIDYSLWPENDKSYGFITRGCIRKCKFCFVPKIEGSLYFDKPIDRIVKHKIAIFLDNNILAYDKHMDVLQELVDKKICCQFKQGLDIRLLNEENMKLLAKINYYQKYIFAFDDIRYEKSVSYGTKLFQRIYPGKWKCRYFVYYNADNPLSDLIYRTEWCKNNGILPYIMRDKNCSSSLYLDFIINFTGWSNSVAGHVCASTFPEYAKREVRDKQRLRETLDVYHRAKKGEI